MGTHSLYSKGLAAYRGTIYRVNRGDQFLQAMRRGRLAQCNQVTVLVFIQNIFVEYLLCALFDTLGIS